MKSTICAIFMFISNKFFFFFIIRSKKETFCFNILHDSITPFMCLVSFFFPFVSNLLFSIELNPGLIHSKLFCRFYFRIKNDFVGWLRCSSNGDFSSFFISFAFKTGKLLWFFCSSIHFHCMMNLFLSKSWFMFSLLARHSWAIWFDRLKMEDLQH